MNQQLSLPIHQIDDETLENFYSDNNALLLNSLCQNMADLQQQFFYLWGNQSVGKTHLLRALCNEYIQQQRSAIYVPLSKSQYFSTAVFENLEQQELVCLDDLQTIIGNSEWEIALFDLFNRIKANGKTLLVVSADQSPTALPVKLPDLASRLKWGESYQLIPLSDEQKFAVLKQNAHQRGIMLSDDTTNFIFTRLDRDMATLKEALVQLDKASLQAKRNLTIPFVKSILGL